jgi:L-asparagine transporter-like permease
MSQEKSTPEVPDHDIAIPIFTVSAGLVGVCLTVITITHAMTGGQRFHKFVDDLLAIDAMVFLTSCVLSYCVLRSRGKRRTHHLETTADFVFLFGLLGLVIVCALIVWIVVEPGS